MVSVFTRFNREPDRRGKYITPIRVYRIADGSLSPDPDSSGKSYLVYSVDKIVEDEADQKAIMELVNPTVKEAEQSENKDASASVENKAAKKPVRRKRSKKQRPRVITE